MTGKAWTERRLTREMRSFEDQNYYQILQVSPSATLSDIKQAYRDTLDLYDEDSLATLSLFSDSQRADLLKDIETAFLTLVDEEKRAAYNQMLLSDGRIEEEDLCSAPCKKTAAACNGGSSTKSNILHRWVAKKSLEPEISSLINHITSKESVSGADLKQLREAFNIEISEVYEITKISPTNLAFIEQDQFDDLPAEIYLKVYLKSYAEILQIDPETIVQGYLKYMLVSKEQYKLSQNKSKGSWQGAER
jgi:curved DNA-binding protein CbpA